MMNRLENAFCLHINSTITCSRQTKIRAYTCLRTDLQTERPRLGIPSTLYENVCTAYTKMYILILHTNTLYSLPSTQLLYFERQNHGDAVCIHDCKVLLNRFWMYQFYKMPFGKDFAIKQNLSQQKKIIHCRWHEIILHVNTIYIFSFWFTMYTCI